MKQLTVGKLAQHCEISVNAIRFYERIGLLVGVKRSQAGYRIYDEAEVERLGFIKNAKQAGFSLDEIKSMLEILDVEGASASIKLKTQQKLKMLDDKIKLLLDVRQQLAALEQQCDGKVDIDDCPIINGLSRTKLNKVSSVDCK